MANISDEELLNSGILNQMPDATVNQDQVGPEPAVEPSEVEEQVVEAPKNEAAQYLGTELLHKPGENPFRGDPEEDKKIIEKHKLSRIGDTIGENAFYRDGWIDVDKRLLGERAIFYPEDWEFRVRPATVEAIRNWSTLDDENANSIDDVFNEILKSCVSIMTPIGPLPWGNICSWDRFFFLLLVREYTFTQGETKIKYEEDCINCDNPVTFELNSQSLMYEMPDPEVMKYYDQKSRTWTIDPEEFEIEGQDVIRLYVPTLEKDANIKAWAIARLQENRNRKIDQTFLRFLMWMAPKISKDTTISQKQIKGYEMTFKSWDADMFSFMDDVLRNIIVMPSSKLTTKCEVCGEEMTSEIRFPGSVRDLFNVQKKHKKFGKK